MGVAVVSLFFAVGFIFGMIIGVIIHGDWANSASNIIHNWTDVLFG